MGRAKEDWMELDEMNLGHIPDKFICNQHLNDYAINEHIDNISVSGKCSYCNKEKDVIPLRALMFFIMEGISFLYENAANWMSYNTREGGYQGTIYTPDELIQEQLGLDSSPFEVIDDIVSSISEIAWSTQTEYRDTERDELFYRWIYFKSIIKHKSRFMFFHYTGDVLDSYFGADILKMLEYSAEIIKYENLLTLIPVGTILYRCRQHKQTDSYTEISQMVSPPDKFAIFSNRFSPSGISMLYAAFDKNTSFVETVVEDHIDKNYVSTAEFTTKAKVRVIDFSLLPAIPSLLDQENQLLIYSRLFLKDLVKDMTLPIKKDGKEHIDYIPTQLVTEYFRYVFGQNEDTKIDGIIYPSSKVGGENSIVLFWDNKTASENLKLISISKNQRSNAI